jgi:hypothetical protein
MYAILYSYPSRVSLGLAKSIETKFLIVRDRVAIGEVRVLHVPTTSQFADIFTKGLLSSTFTEFRSSLNITSG